MTSRYFTTALQYTIYCTGQSLNLVFQALQNLAVTGRYNCYHEKYVSIWYFISWEGDKNLNSVTGRNTFECAI